MYCGGVIMDLDGGSSSSSEDELDRAEDRLATNLSGGGICDHDAATAEAMPCCVLSLFTIASWKCVRWVGRFQRGVVIHRLWERCGMCRGGVKITLMVAAAAVVRMSWIGQKTG
jgi:hypothetical protein